MVTLHRLLVGYGGHLDLTPAVEIDNTSSDHKGDEIFVEAIAKANPKYLLVLDRDAATIKDGEESIPASDVIEGSQAWQM